MRTCIDCGIDYYRKTFIGMERVVYRGEVKFLPEYITEPLNGKQRCYRCNRLKRNAKQREIMRRRYKRLHKRPTLRQRVRKVLSERTKAIEKNLK